MNVRPAAGGWGAEGCTVRFTSARGVVTALSDISEHDADGKRQNGYGDGGLDQREAPAGEEAPAAAAGEA